MKKNLAYPQDAVVSTIERKCQHCGGALDFFSGQSGNKAGIEMHALSLEQFRKLYYAQCRDCDTVYYLDTQDVNYSNDYFSKEYQEQYGVTYKEDRPNIRKQNEIRLRWLSNYLPKKNRNDFRILEIGCAMGYFLENLHEQGFENLLGIDVSKYAIKNNSLKDKIELRQSSLADFYSVFTQKEQKPFQMISALYVLEHMEDQKAAWQMITEMLAPGGFLYLALPSTHGPSFEHNRSEWFEKHPVDHYADYSPQNLKKVFKLYDLAAVDFRVPTFHIDRTGGVLAALKNLGDLGEKTYQVICQWNQYGDTIEVLARKNPE